MMKYQRLLYFQTDKNIPDLCAVTKRTFTGSFVCGLIGIFGLSCLYFFLRCLDSKVSSGESLNDFESKFRKSATTTSEIKFYIELSIISGNIISGSDILFVPSSNLGDKSENLSIKF